MYKRQVKGVLDEQARGRARLSKLASKEAMIAAEPSRALYKLRLFQQHTAVLAPAPADRDVQAVYEKPSHDSVRQ